MTRLMLLDSASLYFRAFFAFRDHEALTAADGTVVNALRGITDFVATLTSVHDPDVIVACWDADWRPQWRVDLLPSYKTQRAEADGSEIDSTDGLLGPQVPLIAELFELLGIPVVAQPGFEADDIIGTLCAQATGPVDVVTGDRDLFQLVQDSRQIRVIYPAIGGIRDAAIVDEAWIENKYRIGARQYVDYSVLRGDASDGLPGVRGIGEKTAASLLAEFNDLDAIVAAAADPNSALKPRQRAALLESGDYLDAARQVVTVSNNAVAPAEYRCKPLTGERLQTLREFGDRWGLGSAIDRVATAIGANGTASGANNTASAANNTASGANNTASGANGTASGSGV